jgi:hypothetical protein
MEDLEAIPLTEIKVPVYKKKYLHTDLAESTSSPSK